MSVRTVRPLLIVRWLSPATTAATVSTTSFAVARVTLPMWRQDELGRRLLLEALEKQILLSSSKWKLHFQILKSSFFLNAANYLHLFHLKPFDMFSTFVLTRHCLLLLFAIWKKPLSSLVDVMTSKCLSNGFCINAQAFYYFANTLRFKAVFTYLPF